MSVATTPVLLTKFVIDTDDDSTLSLTKKRAIPEKQRKKEYAVKIKESDTDIEFLPLWKEGDEEEEFCRQLFRKTLATGSDTKERVSLVTPNWETDRIAIMDLVLLKMAIAEAIYFESIPTKVTMNEYIELAKFYSTPKSATFINGVLDTIMPKMVEEGKIKKIGRGLI